jgi:hypothetical protein
MHFGRGSPSRISQNNNNNNLRTEVVLPSVLSATRLADRGLGTSMLKQLLAVSSKSKDLLMFHVLLILMGSVRLIHNLPEIPCDKVHSIIRWAPNFAGHH